MYMLTCCFHISGNARPLSRPINVASSCFSAISYALTRALVPFFVAAFSLVERSWLEIHFPTFFQQHQTTYQSLGGLDCSH